VSCPWRSTVEQPRSSKCIPDRNARGENDSQEGDRVGFVDHKYPPHKATADHYLALRRSAFIFGSRLLLHVVVVNDRIVPNR
jgi:hypothetical protein